MIGLHWGQIIIQFHPVENSLLSSQDLSEEKTSPSNYWYDKIAQDSISFRTHLVKSSGQTLHLWKCLLQHPKSKAWILFQKAPSVN